jgi:hypothetical protein
MYGKKPSRSPYQQKLKQNGNGSRSDIHLQDLLTISKAQHWNGIHREPGKEDALQQHGNGQKKSWAQIKKP